MKEKPHVAHGEPGDRADFLVAQAAVELEMDDFALIAGQCLEDVENLPDRLARVVSFVQVARHRDLRAVVQRRMPRGLLSRIERQIPAHREQPRRHVSPDARRILPAETQEGFLHDVPRRLDVAEEPFGVTDQRPLVEVHGGNDPVRFRSAHSVPT